MSTVKCTSFHLVLVDTFSGWVKSFPITNKMAQTVSNVLLWKIILSFGIPTSIQSHNDPEFTSQISQTLSKALNIPRDFHIPYDS